MSRSCCIRVMMEEDLELVLQWRNHPDIRRFMLTQHEIGLEEHRRWFEKVRVDSTKRLMIVEEEQEPLGFVQFSDVKAGAISDWGFYVRPGAAKGSGRKLGTTALDHAFQEWKLHKVCGQAIEENLASIGLHQSLGFVNEGILREQKQVAEKYCNLICFGLLQSEWK